MRCAIEILNSLKVRLSLSKSTAWSTFDRLSVTVIIKYLVFNRTTG